MAPQQSNSPHSKAHAADYHEASLPARPALGITPRGLAIISALSTKLNTTTSEENHEASLHIMKIVGEIRRSLRTSGTYYDDNGAEISGRQALQNANDHLTLTAGLHRALIRETRAPLERFKKLGVPIAGLNLGLKTDPDDAIPLSHEHFVFLRDLSREDRQQYRVVVVPASRDPYFFEQLFRREQSHVNCTGFDPIVPPSPIAYTELLRVKPLSPAPENRQFGTLKRSEQLVTASIQAVAIAEISALKKGQTLLPHDGSELRAFAGYSPIESNGYMYQECAPALFAVTRDKTYRHFGFDSVGLKRAMACSLEW
jgi:hypothetical protein